MDLFVRGLLMGFSIAAPVGPIGILCIRRTLSYGRLAGFVSGLGAATADAIYGSLAALGLTVVTNLIVSQRGMLQTAGGVYLCYLGLKTAFEKPTQLQPGLPSNIDESVSTDPPPLVSQYASTFFLTLTNPMTIISFIAIFAGLGLITTTSASLGAIALITGVLLGSAAWWFLLTSLANTFRNRFLTPKGSLWINRVSGWIIFGFGIVAIWKIWNGLD